MRLITFLALLCSPISSYAAQCAVINNLTPYQYEVARKGYLHGLQSDLGYTVVAIMWQESKLGLYKINTTDGKYGSYGVGHALIDYRGKHLSSFEKNQLAQKLIDSDDFAIQTIISDLETWKKHSKSWSQMVSRYNGGWKGNQRYVELIRNHVSRIKDCDFV